MGFDGLELIQGNKDDLMETHVVSHFESSPF